GGGHEPVLREKRLERVDRTPEVRELLRRRSTLAGPHQRVPAERDDRLQASAPAGSIRPRSASTSSSVGSPTSCSLYVTRNAGVSRSISRRRSIGVPMRTRSGLLARIVARRSFICLRP